MPFTETVRAGWSKPRSAISSDDTLVTAAADTMKYANVPTYSFKPPTSMNALEVAFTLDAEASEVVAYIFAARKSGDIVLVWTGTLTGGAQEATDGGVWVDTLGTTTDNWITTIKEVDVGGNDRMSRVVFDTCGYNAFFVQFTGLSSETAKAHYSGF
jgi:hypothetical protein